MLLRKSGQKAQWIEDWQGSDTIDKQNTDDATLTQASRYMHLMLLRKSG